MFPDKYDLIGNVYMPKERDRHETFSYSDGEEFERKIGEIIANATDRSLFSRELAASIWDWRSACHLSPVRANILRPLEKICCERVLELGSGCGIITRYLGELGGDVVALEASPMRASITRQRTSELSNVKVVCERIEDFDAIEKFDVVTMIGVLQYSRLFSSRGHRAEIDLLRSAACQLKDDGVLVIAIQNKLGLKYFSGFPEANVDTPYYGIENRYSENSIIRFGLKEITDLLCCVGLDNTEIFLPLPDYHMPASILSSASCKSEFSSLGETLLKMNVVRDRSRPDWIMPAFSIEKAWESVYRNNLAAELANSFLIIAGKKRREMAQVKGGQTVAWHYSVERHPYFCIERRFDCINDKVKVTSRRVVNATSPSNILTHSLKAEDFKEGGNLWESLLDIVNIPNWSVSDISQWSKKWLHFICEQQGLKHDVINQTDVKISGDFIDCTPLNCIEAGDGSINFIDKEWRLRNSISIQYLFLRGMIGSLMHISSCAEPSPGTPLNIIELSKAILLESGFLISGEHVENYFVVESQFQNLVKTGKENEVDESWRDYVMTATLAVRADYRKALQAVSQISDLAKKSSILASRVVGLESENSRLTSVTADLLGELDEIRNSRAFQLINSVTKLLRFRL